VDNPTVLTLTRPPGSYARGVRVPEPADTPLWYTVEEVAGIVRMSQKWVRAKIRSLELPAKRIHGRGNGEYRISAAALAAFMESLPDARTD
jgi:excisionase family DNA binding protein